MKNKLLAAIATIIILATLTSCDTVKTNSNNVDNDVTDSKQIQSEVITNPDITEKPNYTDFGFNNINDDEMMNTWIEFKKISVEDPENAYICNARSDYATMTFNNGFLKQERWGRNDNGNKYYDCLDSGGCLWHTDKYSIIDNNTIQLYNYRGGGATLSIVDKTMYSDIPALTCKFNTYYYENTCDGIYIPAYFIDWSRSPETIVYSTWTNSNGEKVENESAKYYLKPEFLK